MTLFRKDQKMQREHTYIQEGSVCDTREKMEEREREKKRKERM
jgi:hypothetical protein